jgi:hypothetical protein
VKPILVGTTIESNHDLAYHLPLVVDVVLETYFKKRTREVGAAGTL